MIINHPPTYSLLAAYHGSRSVDILPPPPRCLAVTTDRRQRDSIRLAAALHTNFACDTAATLTELEMLATGRHPLVFIDLAGLVGRMRRRAARLAAKWSRRQATLVIVCGRAQDDDERLVERLGGGLFLPGVSLATAVNFVLAEFARPVRPTAGCTPR